MKLLSLLAISLLTGCAWLSNEIHVWPKFSGIESRNKRHVDALIVVTFGTIPKEEKLEREKRPWEINE